MKRYGKILESVLHFFIFIFSPTYRTYHPKGKIVEYAKNFEEEFKDFGLIVSAWNSSFQITDKASIYKVVSNIEREFGLPFKGVASNLILTKVHNILKEKDGFKEML